MRRTRYIAIFAIIASLALILSSCQNIFGSKTDPAKVYGDWRYQKDNGSGIDLSLTPDGTYKYREFGTRGTTVYENEGKYSLTASRLILKDIDEDDGIRYSVYSISMNSSSENLDVLDLVPKITAKYSFKRVGAPVYVAVESSAKKEEVKLPIEGEWISQEFGTIAISGKSIDVELASGDRLSADISEIEGSTLTLSFNDTMIDVSGYEKANYFIVNNSLYVVFEQVSNIPVVFMRR